MNQVSGKPVALSGPHVFAALGDFGSKKIHDNDHMQYFKAVESTGKSVITKGMSMQG